MANIYKPKYSLNHQYFTYPTLENCYWAGFLAADGNIGIKDNRIGIKLHLQDKEHLCKLQKIILYDGEVTENCVKRLSCNLRFSSKQIKLDLEKNFNITPQKTLTLIEPNLLDKKMIYAFIAGYIDGDGSYCWSGRNHKRPNLSIYGTERMLSWIKRSLGDINNKICYVARDRLYSITFSGNKALYARSFYIDLPLPFLERKYLYWEKTKSELNDLSVLDCYNSFQIPIVSKD